jgi:hypothetical protein
MTTWHAHPLCPTHLVPRIESYANSLPASWHDHPFVGELFDSTDHCYTRLQAFAFLSGFAIVKGKGNGGPNDLRARYKCIHHGKETTNWRGLEDSVEKDEHGNIISQRKRQGTFVKKQDCEWAMWVSYKPVYRGSEEKAWQLGISYQVHSHPLVFNPLSYAVHNQSTPQFQQAIMIALPHRSAMLAWSASNRILDQLGLGISRRQYYNLLRHQKMIRSDNSFKGLLAALDEAGFEFRSRLVPQEPINGVPQPDVMEQIFFLHEFQRRWAQRFVAGFALIIDGTFNTNRLRMPLIICVGITNTGRTFPIAISFAMSESKVAYAFIFACLIAMVFTNGVIPPGVVIGDQSGGLIAAMPEALPGVTLQFCDWHAVENVKKRLAKNGYKKEERDHIINAMWAYVKCDEDFLVDVELAAVKHFLQPAEITYLDTYWKPKEQQLVHCYTKLLPNLAATSSQRVEGIHPVFKQVLHGQLSLEAAAKNIGEYLQRMFNDLSLEEDRSRIDRPRLWDSYALRYLVGAVTLLCLEKIIPVWEFVKQKYNAADPVIPSNECICPLKLQFGLPCAHYLTRCVLAGMPIPLSLVHPRWYLMGPPITDEHWQPNWIGTSLPAGCPYLDGEQNKNTNAYQQVDEVRKDLNAEGKSRLDQLRIKQSHLALNTAQALAAAQARPARLPDPIAKPDWLQQKKLKDKVIRRGMTGAEMAVRAANKAERELNAESRRAAESQGGTTITLAMRPNAVITELADGWLEVPQALSPRVSTLVVPEVAEEVGVPKVLEGVVVEKAAFASTAPPVMEILTPPLSIRRSKRNLSSEVDYAALAGKRPKRGGRK